jgi:type IV pilus assembly protein PilV
MHASLRPRLRLRAQRGIVLIDAMVAVVIFSIGVLGMVALQAAAIKLSGDAKYRSDAAMATEQVIAQMWASDPAALAANFRSPEGEAYKTWKDTVTRLTAQSGLPG